MKNNPNYIDIEKLFWSLPGSVTDILTHKTFNLLTCTVNMYNLSRLPLSYF